MGFRENCFCKGRKEKRGAETKLFFIFIIIVVVFLFLLQLNMCFRLVMLFLCLNQTVLARVWVQTGEFVRVSPPSSCILSSCAPLVFKITQMFKPTGVAHLSCCISTFYLLLDFKSVQQNSFFCPFVLELRELLIFLFLIFCRCVCCFNPL